MEQCRGGCSHEMVNSPATAATMAYPSLEEQEERRSYGGEPGQRRRRHRRHDHTSHEPAAGETVARSCGHDHASAAGGRGVATDPRHGSQSHDPTASVLNRDFAHSYRPMEPGEAQSDGRRKPNRKRSRKQSLPRKVTGVQEFEEDDPAAAGSLASSGPEQEDCREEEEETGSGTNDRMDVLKKRYRRALARWRSFKCRLCPEGAPARGSVRRPYHTRASLALHNLWRHGKRKRSLKSCASRERSQSQVSSITLRATVFTSPGYGYHR